MHQSGHSREQSMQTVQFSSMSAITPPGAGGQVGLDVRVLPGRGRRVMVLRVTPSPLMSPTPLSAGI
jgi:hypothetical protein